MIVGTYNKFQSGSVIGYSYECTVDTTDKKVLQEIIREFVDIRDNKDLEINLAKSEIRNLFFEYQMQQSKNWDKDFEDFWKVFKVKSQKVVLDWLHGQYMANTKLEVITQAPKVELKKPSLPSLNISQKPSVESEYDWKDSNKSLNERIREGHKKGIPASDLAKLMDVKTSRISSVYYKINKK
jgi:hypothetical protein